MENFTLVHSLTLNMGLIFLFLRFFFLVCFEEVHVCFCCMNVQVPIITARKYIWVCRKCLRIAEAGEMNIKLVY
jgi:hypothetical protein